MTGVLLFIVLPLVVLILGGILVALLASGGKGPDDRQPPMGNNFIDWML